MSRRITALFLGIVAPLTALAGPTEDFLAARQKYAIEKVTAPEDLKEMETAAFLELRGKVIGTIKGEQDSLTILFKFGNVSQTIEVKKVPEWVEFDVSLVRVIVKATPVSSQLYPVMELVASIPETDAEAMDAKIKAEADRIAEEQRRLAEEAKKEITVATSQDTINGYLSSPPENAKFGGVIGSRGNATAQQLLSLVPDYQAVVMDNNRSISAEKARLIAECVLAYSSAYGVDARLVMAIIKHESNFNPLSTSNKGAQGLGQLMPDTWQSLGISDPYDIVQNVYGTVRTIRGHLERQGKESSSTYDQLSRALAAYNAGPGAVKKYDGVPPYAETQAYVQRVIKTYLNLSGQN